MNTKAEPSKRMKRGSYREAIRWIAENDDTVWVDDVNAYGPADLSVTATLIADLFDVEHERVRVDIRRELDKYQRLHRGHKRLKPIV